MNRIRPLYYLFIAIVLILITPYFQQGTNAHPLAPSLLEITQVSQYHAEVKWKLPIQGVAGNTLHPQLPPHCSQSGVIGIQKIGTALIRQWEVECDSPLVGSTINVSGIANSKANVILRIFLHDGRKLSTVLTSDNSSFVIPDRDSPLAVAWSYLNLGFEHILRGLDHLLFILGLMLLVSDRRQLLLTITAFTVGHSITLSIAVLGIVKIPQAPVEALIALSIFILAVELTRDQKFSPTLIHRYPWAMALAFGFLHGLGFAGALSEIGLPAGEIPIALFSFNAGIEVGQLLFVVIILALQVLVKYAAVPIPARTVLVPTYLIGTLSAYWFFERISRIIG